MDTLVLSDGKNAFRMQLVRWDGDAYVSVVVNSNGFSGSSDLYVLGEELRSFCAGLVAIQRCLKGE